jgi:hypothetical protein
VSEAPLPVLHTYIHILQVLYVHTYIHTYINLSLDFIAEQVSNKNNLPTHTYIHTYLLVRLRHSSHLLL